MEKNDDKASLTNYETKVKNLADLYNLHITADGMRKFAESVSRAYGYNKKDVQHMTINGFEYTQDEVLEALKKKDYMIVRWNYEYIDDTFPNGKTLENIITFCALKKDLPSEENIWYKVAEKEFAKQEKPILQ